MWAYNGITSGTDFCAISWSRNDTIAFPLVARLLPVLHAVDFGPGPQIGQPISACLRSHQPARLAAPDDDKAQVLRFADRIRDQTPGDAELLKLVEGSEQTPILKSAMSQVLYLKKFEQPDAIDAAAPPCRRHE
jgi:hypothetical protein